MQRESDQQKSECVHHPDAGDVTCDAAHKVQEQSAGQKYSVYTEDLHQDIMRREWLIYKHFAFEIKNKNTISFFKVLVVHPANHNRTF